MSGSYIVGGEAGAGDEEDAEYRQAWNLPTRPAAPAAAASSLPLAPASWPTTAARAGSDPTATARVSGTAANASVATRGSSATGGGSAAAGAAASSSAPRDMAATAPPSLPEPHHTPTESRHPSDESLKAHCERGGAERGSAAAASQAEAAVAAAGSSRPESMRPADAPRDASGAVNTEHLAVEAHTPLAHEPAAPLPSAAPTPAPDQPSPLASAHAELPPGSHNEASATPPPPVASSASREPTAEPTADYARLPPEQKPSPRNVLWLLGLIWQLCRLLVSLTHASFTAALHAIAGLMHAHNPRLSYRHLLLDATSRKCTFQCLMLDVLLFRGALYVYEGPLPQLCDKLLGTSLIGDWRYDLAVVTLWAAPAYVICEIVTTSLQYKMAKQMVAEAAAVSPSGGSGGGGVAALRAEKSEGDAMIMVASMAYTRFVYLAFVLQLRVLCALPFVGTALTLVLSALLHAYDSFEFVWEHQGYGVAQRFALIEHHWFYFLGYGGVLASLSIHLRFWDLFALRAAIYPLYIANAPHARFETRRAARSIPVFQLPLVLFNSILQLAALKLGAKGA